MEDKSLGFKLVTNYIDYNDLDRPVKRLIQTVHAYIVPDLTQLMTIEERLTTLSTLDQMFQMFSNPTEI